MLNEPDTRLQTETRQATQPGFSSLYCFQFCYLMYLTAQALCACDGGAAGKRQDRSVVVVVGGVKAPLESRMLSHWVSHSCLKLPKSTGCSRGRVCLSCCWREVRTVGGPVSLRLWPWFSGQTCSGVNLVYLDNFYSSLTNKKGWKQISISITFMCYFLIVWNHSCKLETILEYGNVLPD